MADRRYTGNHANHLGGGRPIAPGDTIKAAWVDPDHPHNQQLINDGLLPEIPAPAKRTAAKTQKEAAK